MKAELNSSGLELNCSRVGCKAARAADRAKGRIRSTDALVESKIACRLMKGR
jgi:hypothetical protein